ncbi:AMP-binding protein [Haloechinothrix salitolerans]|uniref:AMP-binding protein n=1 Tax=Haloechinothrix salitolerans TaxID=926830 RepID=A0ABW2C3I5_9PSEU
MSVALRHCPDRLVFDRVGPVDDLIRAARQDPSRAILRTRDHEVTVGELVRQAREAAGVLRRRGVHPGDRVGLLCGSSFERVAWMFGIWWAGAIEVSINTELRGPMMAHVLTDSDPGLVVCQRSLVGRVDETSAIDVLVIEDVAPEPVAPALFEELDAIQVSFQPEDLATILYTSGTTGPSKGVMLPRAYFSNLAEIWAAAMEFDEGDVGYFPLPFFHVDAHVLITAAIQTGSVLAFRERFSVSGFFDDIRHFGATWALGVGSMLSMLAQGDLPEPGSLPLTRMLCAPVPDIAYEVFEDRLGIPILTLFGQTECDAIAMGGDGARRRGSAGRPHPAIDLRIVDDRDRDLPVGQTGEIVFRPMRPHLCALGYWRRPDATVTAWRNLWFHTGDSGHLDEDGYLYFDGRRTDSFRRCGENISAWELERTMSSAEGVRECIAVAVPDEHGGEDELKVFVIPEDGRDVDPAEFIAYCRSVLPGFAVPRYVAVTDGGEFVRSPGTGVVQKHLLSRDIDPDYVYEVER